MRLFIPKSRTGLNKFSFVKKLSIYSLFVITLAIFTIDSFYPNSLRSIRNTISNTFTPVMSLLMEPVNYINNGLNYLNELEEIHEQNLALKEEIEELREYKKMISVYQLENDRFRKLLKYNTRLEKSFITARIIGDTGGLYSRSLLINRGSSVGVKDSQGVMASGSLLGRTAQTAYNSSRVLLLSDINSAIPVYIEGAKQNAMLVGDSTKQPVLKFIRRIYKLEIGQNVITSGHGGLFPPGIPIGEVVEINRQTAKIKLYVNAGDTSYIRIVQFKYNQRLKKVDE